MGDDKLAEKLADTLRTVGEFVRPMDDAGDRAVELSVRVLAGAVTEDGGLDLGDGRRLMVVEPVTLETDVYGYESHDHAIVEAPPGGPTRVAVDVVDGEYPSTWLQVALFREARTGDNDEP